MTTTKKSPKTVVKYQQDIVVEIQTNLETYFPLPSPLTKRAS